MSALRIGLLMHSLNPRGGVVHTLELADALCERGHLVTVFAPARPGQQLFRPTRAQLSVAPVPAHGPELPVMVGTRIDAMAAHLRAQPDLDRLDVLHAQDGITANALAELQSAGQIAGFVRTVHHLDDFDDPQLAAWQARGVRAASQCLCVSALWQRKLAQDWGIEAATVPNGVNLHRFTSQADAAQVDADTNLLADLGIQPQGPVWLAVGGVEARKNPLRLLQAFGLACAEMAKRGGQHSGPPPQLVIAGGASLLDHHSYADEFDAARQALGMAPDQPRADRLRITGPLPDAALPALYRRATALCMPSLNEGFGLVVLEALACGTPAIVSRIAPFTEHLAPHQALWADPLDVADISRALLRSLVPANTQEVLAAAPALCQEFAWARSAERHEMVYRALRSLGRLSGSASSATSHSATTGSAAFGPGRAMSSESVASAASARGAWSPNTSPAWGHPAGEPRQPHEARHA